MRKISILIFLIISLLLAGCQSTPSTANTQSYSDSALASETGYPVSDVFSNEPDSSSGYPVSEELPYPLGPVFSIDVPVNAGETVVTGNGPAGVPINLVDVSEVGMLLGTTVIAADGTFRFELSEGLPEKHQIGLQLGDLDGTNLNANDFVYSDSYYVRPLIGILFDMVVVGD